MSITNGYCTVVELQTAMSRPVSNGDLGYSALEDCINRASRMIDIKTGRIYYPIFLANERVDRYNLSPSGLYADDLNIMSPAPIIAVTALTEDGTALTIDEDCYLYSDRIVNDAGWTYERRGISFSGTIGYSETPQYVKNWCIQIASVLSGLATFSVTDSEGATYTRDKTEIPKWVEKEIRQNRRCLI